MAESERPTHSRFIYILWHSNVVIVVCLSCLPPPPPLPSSSPFPPNPSPHSPPSTFFPSPLPYTLPVPPSSHTATERPSQNTGGPPQPGQELGSPAVRLSGGGDKAATEAVHRVLWDWCGQCLITCPCIGSQSLLRYGCVHVHIVHVHVLVTQYQLLGYNARVYVYMYAYVCTFYLQYIHVYMCTIGCKIATAS